MRILYSAIDQSVPAGHGGSVHVMAVAEGLADLGHDVHVLVSPGDRGGLPSGRARWIALPPPLGDRRLRVLRAGAVTRHARHLRADVVMERYYNFGGEGVIAARRTGAVAVLEVNAPVADHPGSRKALVDRLLIVQPMRRWRDWLCASADLIVIPSARILPPHVPPSRVFRTEWGADTRLFHPRGDESAPFARTDTDVVVGFAGAFRKWHGAVHLVDAIERLRRRGRHDIKALLIGDGPEHRAVQRRAAGLDGVWFVGPIPHESVPAYLAGCDIGAAPFDVQAHPALAYEFHWSPLKVFEYMAAGLPVVAPRIPRLATLVEHGREGWLYDAADPDGLASALERLTDPALRRECGIAARQRAVAQYSWESHCRKLASAIESVCEAKRCAS